MARAAWEARLHLLNAVIGTGRPVAASRGRGGRAGEPTGSTSIHRVGGYVGVLTALGAWYASFAGVANWPYKRTLLPVFPR